jgi:ParB family chromosome partitioning protein
MQFSKEVSILKIDDILPNRFQPRIIFDETAINELTESIKEYGVIEPIIVRKVSDKYEIIAGERRYKASVLAGKETIPAIVTDLNDKESAEIALIENVQRQNLTPIEEAVSYKKILDMGYMNQSELAEKLGKTQSTVANKLRLLNLTDDVQEALLQERISERHARSLLRLPSDKQNEMLDRIVKERMTVRKTDEEIKKILEGESTTETVKEEKEGKNMNNNDFMNQFNIPNTPIMEPTPQPVPPVEPVAPVSETPVTPVMPQMPTIEPVQPPVMAPTAPPVTSNIEPQVSSETPQTINHEPATTENADIPISGRFFNMFGEENAGTEQTETQSISPVMPPVEPQVAPSVETPVAPVTPQMGQPNNFNPFGDIAPIAPSVETQTTPVAPQMPTIEPVQSPVMPVIEPQPVSPVEPVSPAVNTISPLEPIPMPNVPVTPEVQTPFTQPEAINPIQTFQLNDNQEFTNSSVVEMGTFGNRKMEEPTLQPLMDTGVETPKVEMKEIINLIRNCAKQIEQSGYTIDTDELDFDDSYQVIFKINKND